MNDEGSIHDAAAKGKATAQSFSSLMKVTEEKTDAEKEALRVRYNEQTIKYRDQIRRQLGFSQHQRQGRHAPAQPGEEIGKPRKRRVRLPRRGDRLQQARR